MSNDIIIKVSTDYIQETSYSISSEYPIQIDYGDGTPLETYNGTIEHTYPDNDEYTIRIKRVQHIGDDFLYDSDLANAVTEITIPHQITTIGNNFGNCPNLTKINLPNSLTSIGEWFLYGCENLTHVDLPNTLTEIGANFLCLSGIINITIPKGIKKIPEGFCVFCPDLESVNMNEGLEEIGDRFCIGSEQLIRISIPSTVKKIENLFLADMPSGDTFALEEITFHSETPPIVSDDLNEWLRSGYEITFKVPQGTIDIYGHRQNYPDIDEFQVYEECPTLKGSLQKLGARIRNNLQNRGVSSHSNDGLTTLVNKIQDIETNNMTGFLADIGFYDQDSWGGTPPTILKDKIIFHDNAEFPFNNIVFPDTFTWSFILTTHDKRDELTEPITIGQYHSLNFVESVDMEFCIMITRENGGDFIIKSYNTDEEYTLHSLSSKSLFITPYGTKPVTISEIYFSEEYDDYPYSIISYNLCWDNSFHTRSTDIWDNETDTKPTSVPLLLLKNGTPFKSYSLTEATDNLIFRGNSLVPVNYRHHCWGNYHYIFSSDMSNYSWKTIKDIGCQLKFDDGREDLYFPIKHFKKGYSVDESSRLDNYFHNYFYIYFKEHLIPDILSLIGYDEVNLQDYDIEPWDSYSTDGHFDYQIICKNPILLYYPQLFFTFEYIRLDETNNDVGIFIDYTGSTANGSLLFHISNDMFTISNNDTDICSSEKLVFQDYNIITICQTISGNSTLVWDIELNGNSVLSYTSNIFRQSAYTLQRQCYQNNAKISNFYYGSLEEV